MTTASCPRLLVLAACTVLSACGGPTTTDTQQPSRPAYAPAANPPGPVQLAESIASETGRNTETGQHTEEYWNRCIEINEAFVSSKQELWFKSMRPNAIGKTLREAASKLRGLEQTNVDGNVVDHVNAVMRGYEDMAGIVEKEGSRAIWNEAATIGLFLLEIAVTRKATTSDGTVADAGNIPVGVGSFSEIAYNFKTAAEGDVKKKANELIESEVVVIRHVRETYGRNLKPW